MGVRDDVVPEHPGLTGVGTQERGEHADGRRLAGAVGPEDPVDGARAHGEVHAVDGAVRAEDLHEALGLDRGDGHVSSWSVGSRPGWTGGLAARCHGSAARCHAAVTPTRSPRPRGRVLASTAVVNEPRR
ncbi:Uncharacterised protein [Mycobacteroides abscessus]|nr:Uncharacterised protein [Mycobacteroides abscessus]